MVLIPASKEAELKAFDCKGPDIVESQIATSTTERHMHDIVESRLS